MCYLCNRLPVESLLFTFSYEDLLKAFDKAKPVIEKEEKGIVPRFYIRYDIPHC